MKLFIKMNRWILLSLVIIFPIIFQILLGPFPSSGNVIADLKSNTNLQTIIAIYMFSFIVYLLWLYSIIILFNANKSKLYLLVHTVILLILIVGLPLSFIYFIYSFVTNTASPITNLLPLISASALISYLYFIFRSAQLLSVLPKISSKYSMLNILVLLYLFPLGILLLQERIRNTYKSSS